MRGLRTNHRVAWVLFAGLATAACSDDASLPSSAATPAAAVLDAGPAPRETSPSASSSSTSTGPTNDAPDASDASAVDAGPPLDVPASLVAALGGKTYVEDSCVPATYPGWPHAAKKCTYRTNLTVTIANPDPDRVARWIVDASTLIPALDALHTRDRASWEKGLIVMAKHTIGQSSRIFPLDGQVYEDGTAYKFERGVTKTCSSGCYCRINSTSRPQWCKYASKVLGTETESACLAKYGQTTSSLTDAWLTHCFDNHVASWTADQNPHFRAQAWNANQAIAAAFPNPLTALGADVLEALAAEY